MYKLTAVNTKTDEAILTVALHIIKEIPTNDIYLKKLYQTNALVTSKKYLGKVYVVSIKLRSQGMFRVIDIKAYRATEKSPIKNILLYPRQITADIMVDKHTLIDLVNGKEPYEALSIALNEEEKKERL